MTSGLVGKMHPCMLGLDAHGHLQHKPCIHYPFSPMQPACIVRSETSIGQVELPAAIYSSERSFEVRTLLPDTYYKSTHTVSLFSSHPIAPSSTSAALPALHPQHQQSMALTHLFVLGAAAALPLLLIFSPSGKPMERLRFWPFNLGLIVVQLRLYMFVLTSSVVLVHFRGG